MANRTMTLGGTGNVLAAIRQPSATIAEALGEIPQAGSGQSPLTVISDCPVEAPTATTNKAFGEVGDPDLGVLVLDSFVLFNLFCFNLK